jgi:hypothetical protein
MLCLLLFLCGPAHADFVVYCLPGILAVKATKHGRVALSQVVSKHINCVQLHSRQRFVLNVYNEQHGVLKPAMHVDGSSVGIGCIACVFVYFPSPGTTDDGVCLAVSGTCTKLSFIGSTVLM